MEIIEQKDLLTRINEGWRVRRKDWWHSEEGMTKEQLIAGDYELEHFLSGVWEGRPPKPTLGIIFQNISFEEALVQIKNRTPKHRIMRTAWRLEHMKGNKDKEAILKVPHLYWLAGLVYSKHDWHIDLESLSASDWELWKEDEVYGS